MMNRAACVSMLILCSVVLAAGAMAADGVSMSVSRGAAPGEIRLDWVGGTPTYAVYRSAQRSGVVNPSKLLGSTSGNTWIDSSVPLGEAVLYYKVVGPCLVPTTEVCDGEDNDCDTYVDEGCSTSCASDATCPAIEHCDQSTCQPDVVNGTSCSRDAECFSGHCDGGLCCDAGLCCANDLACSSLSQPPVCDSPSTCQGSAIAGVCSGFQCVAQPVDDDSACAGLESNTCGPYPSITCTGAVSQPADQSSLCPTSCGTDAECDTAAHCETPFCVPDQNNGGFCDAAGDCVSGLCVDGVCCASACEGTCEACDVSGSLGTCTAVPDGTDPDAECGAVSCVGYYWGWTGDTCYRKADVTAAQATCNGARSCRSTAQSCTAQATKGPATTTCDALCQDPTGGTCTGTVAGTCTNVNPGTQTCGLGVCQVTAPQCVNGTPATCTPGSPTTETCNGLDDNCDGTIDNNAAFADAYETNDSCSTYKTLPTVGSNQTLTVNTITLYPSGDVDYFRIPAVETDSTCSCCDLFCTDEDFQLTITLTVPSGAGSYTFCTSDTCGGVGNNCRTVNAQSSSNWVWTFDGACGGANDSYAVYIRISPGSAPGFACQPYILSYHFVPGCF